MKINDLHNVYFLGIGGIGMSALARYFNGMGVEVSGYDRTKTLLTYQLQQEGIRIHYQDDVKQIPENIDLTIYTPAIPKNLDEFVHLTNSGIPVKKRSEVLGLITNERKTIAVAGTHGKTTVTTLTAHILKNSSIDCSAFLGGISKNYKTNLLISDHSDWMVVEADEFDRSFLQLKPEIGIITSMDADHLDIYGNLESLKSNFTQFTKQIKNNGILLIKEGLQSNFTHLPGIQIFTYSITEGSDFYVSNIRLEKNKYCFDFIYHGKMIRDVILGIPGLINLENSVVAMAATLMAGVTEQEIKAALPAFSGIQRRFDYQINTEDLIYIDDYAHHPEEIKGFVSSVKKIYPNKKILGIFQPHLFSRTRDFADEFANSLEMLDEIILLPIYPAREKPIDRVSSKLIFDRINSVNKSLCSNAELINTINRNTFDIILTMGAGDIDQLVLPIKEYLTETKQITN
ncbi:MAG: UDP-N-acetylmuramate--L-alanine ligase [Bacteroidales bacterium]|nr:UDP-N-acetylmuramate--L-alanine ligase [Bacteroidales bacterium]